MTENATNQTHMIRFCNEYVTGLPQKVDAMLKQRNYFVRTLATGITLIACFAVLAPIAFCLGVFDLLEMASRMAKDGRE